MSGNLIGGIIGVGAALMSGGALAPALGWTIGSVIGSLLFPPKGPDGPRLSDLKPQSSEYGRPIPIIYGTMGTAGNVIWASNLIESKHESSGKGGPTQTTYSYSANFAVMFCEGTRNIGRIWAGPERRLIWDGTTLESGTLRLYDGDESQLPDPLIESFLGVGNVPAYRGLTYAVFEGFQLSNDFNAIPAIFCEIIQSAPVGPAPPIHKISLAEYAAIDPDTGYVWATFNNVTSFPGLPAGTGVSIVDPVSETIVHYISLPDAPRGIAYNQFNGTMIVSNDTAIGLSTQKFGWQIDPTTYSVNPAVGASPYDGSFGTYSSLVTVDSYNIVFWTGNFGGSCIGIAFNPLTGAYVTTFAGYGGGINVAVDTAGDLTYNVLQCYDRSLKTELAGVSPLFSITNFNASNVPETLLAWNSTLGKFYALRPSTKELFLLSDVGYSSLATFSFLDNTPGSGIHYPTAIYYDSLRSSIWLSTSDTVSTVGNLYEIDANSYSVKQTILGAGPIGTASGIRMARVPGHNKLVWWSSFVYTIPFAADGSGVTQVPVLISDVVSDISARAGLTTGQIDVTALTDTVSGYAITNQMDTRSAIDPLRTAFYFDAVESNGKVKFVKRGGQYAVVVPDSDLAAHTHGSGVPDPLLTTRTMEVDLPKFVNIKYQLYETNYQAAEKQAKRLIGSSGNETTIDLPMVLTDKYAQGVADTNLYTAWTQRLAYSFALPRKYAYLEPTDVIVVKGHVMRIDKVTQSPDGILSMEAVADDTNNYTQKSIAVETPQIVQTVFVPSPTRLVLMDINMLRDQDNDPGFYAAACGTNPATWKGCILYRSTDGGSNYSVVNTIITPATIGTTINVLGDYFGGEQPDTLNHIDVSLTSGSLSSVNYQSLINGDQTVLVGDEVINFQTATLNLDGSYTLTGLVRGRRGTEFAMSNHAAGERLVLLTFDSLIRVSAQTSDIGITDLYKGVSSGLTLGTTPAVSFVDNAAGLMPYSPVLLGGGFDASNNATLTWTARSRINGAWIDGTDVPVGEAIEAYDVEIWDSAYATLKRTFSSLPSQTATYTAAQQTTDFGSTQSTIYYRVYQLSASIGRGYGAQGTAPASTTIAL